MIILRSEEGIDQGSHFRSKVRDWLFDTINDFADPVTRHLLTASRSLTSPLCPFKSGVSSF